MCTRTSKNKGQSGRRLNTLVAFFEFSFKILESFWDLYFFFCQKISKMVQFCGACGFLEHKNSCYFMHWWFMKRIMMMFSYWIPEVRFWIAQNYSRKTTSRSCFDQTEIQIRPFYEKWPKMTEPCEHVALWFSVLEKIPGNVWKILSIDFGPGNFSPTWFATGQTFDQTFLVNLRHFWPVNFWDPTP